VSWCSVDGPDSGIERVRALCRRSSLYSQTVCHTCRELHNCCFIFHFVVICFSSMAFGLHLFCGGGYCGCVSLNIFSASLSWFSFALRRCNFCFCDRVNLNEHHRGMEYFGSVVLLTVVPSFFACHGRFTKNHRPFIIFLYDGICCSYFDDVSFCRPVGGCSYMPPAGLVGLCGRVVRQYCWTRA
jgi:hypothetical protein